MIFKTTDLTMSAWNDGDIVEIFCDSIADATDEDDIGDIVFQYVFENLTDAKDFLKELKRAIKKAENYKEPPPKPLLKCNRCGIEKSYLQDFASRHFCSDCIEIIVRLYRSDTSTFKKDTEEKKNG